MLIAITNDLMAAAPIEQAARQVQLPCRTLSLSQLADVESAAATVVVFDLNAADEVAPAVATIRERLGASIPILAFGPHVHTEKLAAARQAGCAQVLTRGQFHQSAAKALAALLAGDA